MSATAAIHVARKQLDLDDDAARDLYQRVTGKRSLRDMSEAERRNVVGELRKQGFKPASKVARKPLDGPFAKKLQALWIGAWNLGIVTNRDDRALLAFLKRQTGIDHTRFLHYASDADKVIEALKGWMNREAGVLWLKADIGERAWEWLHRDGAKIAVAQWRYLTDVDGCPNVGGFGAFVRDTVGADLKSFDEVTDRMWIDVMNALGEHVRTAKRAQQARS